MANIQICKRTGLEPGAQKHHECFGTWCLPRYTILQNSLFSFSLRGYDELQTLTNVSYKSCFSYLTSLFTAGKRGGQLCQNKPLFRFFDHFESVHSQYIWTTDLWCWKWPICRLQQLQLKDWICGSDKLTFDPIFLSPRWGSKNMVGAVIKKAKILWFNTFFQCIVCDTLK